MRTKFASNFTLNGIVPRTIWPLTLGVLLFVFEAVARQPFGGSVAGLNGQWYHNGATTRILVARDGRSIAIIDEFNQRTTASRPVIGTW
jgi:hypothetical protein